MAISHDAVFKSGMARLSYLRQTVHSLLNFDKSVPRRCKSRENTRLEFKESFNFGNLAEYARTMAAFSNARGGFIVFGIKDSPRELVGVDTEKFNGIDGEKLSTGLNSFLEPAIDWEVFTVTVDTHTLGVIAVAECENKPVICIRNSGKTLKEGDIYYRYSGQTRRIKHQELRQILMEGQERVNEKWRKIFSEVSRIGVENVQLLDMAGKEMVGKGGRLLISDELIKGIHFIREGHFTERQGEGLPTLKMVGEVHPISSEGVLPFKTIQKEVSINENDILEGFLKQREVQSPKEYLRQAARESSHYLPIFYYARLAGLNAAKLRDYLNEHCTSRSKLLERLDNHSNLTRSSITAQSDAGTERRAILEKLNQRDFDDLLELNRLRLFEAITHYESANTLLALLEQLALIVSEEFSSFKGRERTAFRKAVAHLDQLQNGGDYL